MQQTYCNWLNQYVLEIDAFSVLALLKLNPAKFE